MCRYGVEAPPARHRPTQKHSLHGASGTPGELPPGPCFGSRPQPCRARARRRELCPSHLFRDGTALRRPQYHVLHVARLVWLHQGNARDWGEGGGGKVLGLRRGDEAAMRSSHWHTSLHARTLRSHTALHAGGSHSRMSLRAGMQAWQQGDGCGSLEVPCAARHMQQAPGLGVCCTRSKHRQRRQHACQSRHSRRSRASGIITATSIARLCSSAALGVEKARVRAPSVWQPIAV